MSHTYLKTFRRNIMSRLFLAGNSSDLKSPHLSAGVLALLVSVATYFKISNHKLGTWGKILNPKNSGAKTPLELKSSRLKPVLSLVNKTFQ